MAEIPRVTLRDLECMEPEQVRRILAQIKGAALKALAREAGISLSNTAAEIRELLYHNSQYRASHLALREGITVEEARRRLCQERR